MPADLPKRCPGRRSIMTTTSSTDRSDKEARAIDGTAAAHYKSPTT